MKKQVSEIRGQKTEVRNIAPWRKLRLITRAIQRHPGEEISFYGKATCWDECFTLDNNNPLTFRYNVGKDARAIEEGALQVSGAR